MTFTESNTVEAYLRALLCGPTSVAETNAIKEAPATYGIATQGLGWTHIPASQLPRQPQDVFPEPLVRDALIRLNPEIAAQPERADEVLYKLRAIVLSVRSDGLIRANEEFTAWLRGERSMPFGKDGEHVTVRLVDFDDLSRNQYVVTTQYTYRAGPAERRADLMLLVNGLPLVLIEAKTPVRPSVSWVDGAIQVHDDYEKFVPELFACNVFSVATEGKELRYGSIHMPVHLWGPWRAEAGDEGGEDVHGGLGGLQRAVRGLLAPETVLDILANFTLFATDKKKRRLKLVCRYQQYEGANRIVERVVAGQPKRGLIWHFQGSGKSLLMVFAAQKLRLHPRLKNPTVLIVVDRIELDAQISATFHGADVANLVKAETRRELKTLLRQDTRKIIITTIFKFGEETPRQTIARLLGQIPELHKRGDASAAQAGLETAWRALAKLDDGAKQAELREALTTLATKVALPLPAADGGGTAAAATTDDVDEDAPDSPVLNDRHNIIALVDEAHRTQEGDLGMQMRAALPNAFLFGLTGTPINKRDRNTFYAFGAPEDSNGYLSRYGFEESIRDGATLPLHFEPRLVDLHIDREAIDQAYKDLTGSLSDVDRDNLAKTAARMAVLVKAPERIQAICADIAKHFQASVAPNGFKAMVVTFDQECCLLYKEALDAELASSGAGNIETDIVISVQGKDKDDARWKPYRRDRDAEEALLDRYRDPKDPLQILIVTAKLLTGFDAPILQAQYLDKPLRDHTLLQAITRTNRTYSQPGGVEKSHGLIIDYLGVFDDVAKALDFDEKGFQRVASNIAALKGQLPGAVQKCLAYFPGVDRSLTGYEGLIAAQECLPDNATRDAFAADISVLSKLWEALSPDPMLKDHEDDYRWLVQVYESVKPSTGQGALLWHALGAKTVELIHQHVHVDAIRDDLDDLVFDADVIEAILDGPDAGKKTKEIEIKLTARLRKHLGNPRFKPLSERLEALRERHLTGQIESVDFLKHLLDIARDVVAAEKEVPPEEDEDRGKAALTELFEQVKNPETPVMVERVVGDVDEIVRVVRFPGWQNTSAGEREVKKALRGALFKYKLHSDPELFEKAYGYIRQYY